MELLVRGGTQGVEVAPGGLYNQIPRALVRHERDNGGGGPAMRQRHAASSTLYKHPALYGGSL